MLALNSGHTIHHVAAPHLIWFCHCELPPKVIRDSYMLATIAFITVRRQLASPSSFMSLLASQRPIMKPLRVAIVAMLLAPAEPWLMLCNSRTWLRNTARLPSGLSGRLFQYL